jgi:MraZ protein
MPRRAAFIFSIGEKFGLGPPDSDRLVITNYVIKDMRCLDVYPLSAWLLFEEELRKEVRGKNFTDRRVVLFQDYYLARACECLVDKRGRVLIPPMLRQYAQIGANIILVAARDKFRIWNPVSWKTLVGQAEQKLRGDREFLEDLGLISYESNREHKQIEIVPASAQLLELLRENLANIYNLSPENFELFICERLDRMGFAVQRVGTIYVPDGGVDIVACPRTPTTFPYLLAVQTKCYRSPGRKTGPGAVKDLQAVVARQPFQGGLLVTNTSFTPDATWFAANCPHIVRLRDIGDLERWIADNFLDEAEWRELPRQIELRPGVFVPIPRYSGEEKGDKSNH